MARGQPCASQPSSSLIFNMTSSPVLTPEQLDKVRSPVLTALLPLSLPVEPVDRHRLNPVFPLSSIPTAIS